MQYLKNQNNNTARFKHRTIFVKLLRVNLQKYNHPNLFVTKHHEAFPT